MPLSRVKMYETQGKPIMFVVVWICMKVNKDEAKSDNNCHYGTNNTFFQYCPHVISIQNHWISILFSV